MSLVELKEDLYGGIYSVDRTKVSYLSPVSMGYDGEYTISFIIDGCRESIDFPCKESANLSRNILIGIKE